MIFNREIFHIIIVVPHSFAVPEFAMMVIACIKQVPDTTQVAIDPKTNTLIRDGVPFITNPYDTHALEEALRLKDRYGFFVVALSMGPPNAQATLRRALAHGADRSVLLSDRAFGGADTLATSKVIAAAIEMLAREMPLTLVLCGKQSIDGDTAQVGPGIASRLGIPQLTLVDRVEYLDPTTKRMRVRRKLEGRHERVEAPLPSLITVVREINRPRYPKVAGRLSAATKVVELWDNKVMGLDQNAIGLRGSPTKVSRIFSPTREPGEILGDGLYDPAGAAGLLLEKLLAKDLLPLS